MDLLHFFNTEGNMTLELVVASLFIGVVIASVGALYHKQILGALVRKLLSEGASSPGTALTLKELGFAKKRLVRFALRDGSTFRKIVHLVDAAEKVEGEKSDLDTARFYLPAELTERAEMQYSGSGSGIVTVLISVLVFFAAAVVSLMVIPWISGLFEGLGESIRAIFN